jgi:hypothetical protein
LSSQKALTAVKNGIVSLDASFEKTCAYHIHNYKSLKQCLPKLFRHRQREKERGKIMDE